MTIAPDTYRARPLPDGNVEVRLVDGDNVAFQRVYSQAELATLTEWFLTQMLRGQAQKDQGLAEEPPQLRVFPIHQFEVGKSNDGDAVLQFVIGGFRLPIGLPPEAVKKLRDMLNTALAS